MSPTPEVMKWFTRARRFPQLIGRTPDGARIPGGPYTVTQVVGAGAVLFVGTRTMGLWAHYGLLSNAVILLSVAAAVVFALGKIPVGSRNPLSVSTGTLRALSAPPTGRVAGRPVRLRRPHQIQHRVVVQQPAPATPLVAAPAPAASATRRAAPAAAPQPAPATPASAGPRRPRPPALSRRTATHAPSPAAPAAGAAVPAPRAAPALTTVQALLAQASAASPTGSVVVLPRPSGRSRPKDR